MSVPIKTTDITGKPFWAIQEAFGKPMTAYQMAGMLNAAIKHGIVSLPNHELLARLESMAAQHACGCGHPACKRCADDRMNQDVIKRAKGGAE